MVVLTAATATRSGSPMPPDPDKRSGQRFIAAVEEASRYHAGQLRKGTEVPYLAHLLSVAALVLEDGGSEDEAIAALLHDAVEDAGGRRTLEAIRERFGDEVAMIVMACSDTDATPKPPWRARKESYLAHLADETTPASVLRVSLADKLHNARAILSDYRILGEDCGRGSIPHPAMTSCGTTARSPRSFSLVRREHCRANLTTLSPSLNGSSRPDSMALP